MILKIMRCFYTTLISVILLSLSAGTAEALIIIRDDEIERFLKEISIPIFKAAGLNPSDVSIVIIGDDAVNAYVSGGQNIFIYSGLIEKTENIDELVGVIAHETGHISSGHLARGSEALEKASYQTVLSTVLGVAVGVASGNAQAAMGVSLGGAEAAKRGFLKNSRTFEASADQSAVAYLKSSGYSTSGLVSFLKKLADQEVLPESQQDEYVMTHPISAERISLLESNVVTKMPRQGWSSRQKERYLRIREKISAYRHPEKFSGTDEGLSSATAVKYGRVIAAYRTGDVPSALSGIDSLILTEKDNPYFYELKGQILFEEGKIDKAANSYRKAFSLLPDSGPIAVAFGHVLIEKNTKETDTEAIGVLNKALQNEKRSPEIYRFLSIAYGRNKNEGMAGLCLAEEALLRRNYILAGRQAVAALKKLEKNSPAYNRAQDLIKLVKDTKL